MAECCNHFEASFVVAFGLLMFCYYIADIFTISSAEAHISGCDFWHLSEDGNWHDSLFNKISWFYSAVGWGQIYIHSSIKLVLCRPLHITSY